MKHNINRIPFIVLWAAILLTGCAKDLVEKDRVNLSSSNFPDPSNPSTYFSVAYQSVAAMRNMFGYNSYWDLVECTTDEHLIPTRGGDWGDGGLWQTLDMHTWSADLSTINQGWNWGFSSIGKCNSILKTLNEAPEFTGKTNLIAQVRAMRALYYFYMIDAFGNVPIYLKTDLSEGLPVTSSSADVFKFIETELLDIQAPDQLPTNVDANSYGLPTLGFSQALLAKLYLNAQIYTGTPKWTECINQCDALINSGKYGYSEFISNFQPRIPTPLAAQTLNKYMSIFAPDNGPQIKESIFAVATTAPQASSNFFSTFFLPHPANLSYLELNDGGGYSGGCSFPEFFSKFNDSNDLRNKMWLSGPLYKPDGVSIVTNPLDGNPYIVTPTLKFGVANPANPYDLGGTADGQSQGVRSIKYYPDGGPTSQQNNDYQIFRYADIVLMKGEALARKEDNPMLALPAVNEIRTERNASSFTTLSWNDLLDERAREFAYEGWRRNDLIRFGQWGNAWGIKTNNDAYRTLFPIPTPQLQLNKNLKQNPGY